MNTNRKLAWEAIQRHLDRRAREAARQAEHQRLVQAMAAINAQRWQLTTDDARFLRALGVDPR